MARRRFMAIAAGSAVAGLTISAIPLSALADDGPADQRPTVGDRLVKIDDSGAHTFLKESDLTVDADPILAFPFDPATKTLRDGSRLNKILLLKLPTKGLDDDTLGRAANGVLGFSAICTHQGCEVSSWQKADQDLMCFCHFSKYDPRNGAAVVGGPAPRALPHLSLKSDAQGLMVASTFSSSPGVKQG